MKEIILNCEEMDTMQHAYSHIEESFGFPQGSVSDTDSLVDMLKQISRRMEVTFEDMDLLDIHLGEEGTDELLGAFEEAAAENENIELV